MTKRSHGAGLAALAIVLLGLRADAQQPFLSFDARSVAMGGASVALAEGTEAALVNPAAIGPATKLSPAAAVGLLAAESGDFIEPLERLSGKNPVALSTGAGLADARAALEKLAEPGNGLLGQGHLATVLARSGYAFSVAQRTWGGLTPRIDQVHVQAGNDPATSIAANTSSVAFRSLTLQSVGLTASYPLVAGISIGATAHVIRGTTASKEESVFTTEVGDALQLARRTTTGAERTRTKLSYDVGTLITFGPVRLGGVLLGVNGPSFPFSDDAPLGDRGSSVRWGRQARIGAAVHVPVVGLTVAADLDLTKSDTLTEGLQSRVAGGGVELKLGPIAFRGGLSVNLESPDKTKQFTAGVGISVGVARIDAAALYRPDKSALGAVLSARVGL